MSGQIYHKSHRTVYRRTSRSGIAEFISWVLLLAFTVALSALMYRFIVSFSEDKTEDLKKVVYNLDECKNIALSIESVCQNASTTQDLYINVKHTGSRRVDKLMIRAFGEGKVPLRTDELEIPLNPNREKVVLIAYNDTANISVVQVTPVTFREEFKIICSEKEVLVSPVPLC